MADDASVAAFLKQFGAELEAMYRDAGTPLEPGSGAALAQAMFEGVTDGGERYNTLMRAFVAARARHPGPITSPGFNAAMQEELARMNREAS